MRPDDVVENLQRNGITFYYFDGQQRVLEHS